jgi:nucleoside-diphosphate-sugar epimerase
MSLNGKKVLVTGGAGFIGSHVVDALLAEGAKVKVFFHYNGKSDTGVLEADVLSKIDKVFGSITDASAVHAAVVGSDIVIHMAAIPGIPYSYEHPQEVWDVNAGGTLNVLNACHAENSSVQRVIVTSTSEVYGSADVLPITEANIPKPQSPYAAAKVASDAISRAYYCSFGLPVVIARLFNTHGHRQSDRALIPAVIKQALWSETIKVGALTPRRDYLFATDAAQAFVACALAGDSINGETIHFGTRESWSVQDVIDNVQAILGTSKAIESAEFKRMRPNMSEVTHLLCDPKKALTLLNWKPSVSFKTGLECTIEYMRDRRDKYDPSRYAV